MRFWKNTERLLLIVGVLLIVIYVAAYIHRTILFRAELRHFHDNQSRRPGGIATDFSSAEARSDFGTWSEKRILAYEHTWRSTSLHPWLCYASPRCILRYRYWKEQMISFLTGESAISLARFGRVKTGTSELPAIETGFLGC